MELNNGVGKLINGFVKFDDGVKEFFMKLGEGVEKIVDVCNDDVCNMMFLELV